MPLTRSLSSLTAGLAQQGSLSTVAANSTPKGCKLASVNIATLVGSQDTTVVAAVSGKRIKVYAYSLYTTTGNLGASWLSASTVLAAVPSGALLAGSAPAVNPPAHLVATAAGEALRIRTVGAINTLVGWLAYFDEDAT